MCNVVRLVFYVALTSSENQFGRHSRKKKATSVSSSLGSCVCQQFTQNPKFYFEFSFPIWKERKLKIGAKNSNEKEKTPRRNLWMWKEEILSSPKQILVFQRLIGGDRDQPLMRMRSLGQLISMKQQHYSPTQFRDGWRQKVTKKLQFCLPVNSRRWVISLALIWF